jgi:hypothetical protein
MTAVDDRPAKIAVGGAESRTELFPRAQIKVAANSGDNEKIHYILAAVSQSGRNPIDGQQYPPLDDVVVLAGPPPAQERDL